MESKRELKEHKNVIIVWTPDHIGLEFDQIPDPDWWNVWARSVFPHPLITVDINKDGVPFQVSALGSLAPKLLELYAEWLREIKASRTDNLDVRVEGDRQAFIDRLAAYFHQEQAV